MVYEEDIVVLLNFIGRRPLLSLGDAQRAFPDLQKDLAVSFSKETYSYKGEEADIGSGLKSTPSRVVAVFNKQNVEHLNNLCETIAYCASTVSFF